MARILFSKGKQRKWLENILVHSCMSSKSLSQICGVSQRTINDWRREKLTISKLAVEKIVTRLNVDYPNDVKELNDYWYAQKSARKAAFIRMALYGPPGTKEGRAKGGLISQQKRREHPENYPKCVPIKNFPEFNFSEDMAELIGIILGDGGITHDQLKITLNSVCEQEYIYFVSNLETKIFGDRPKIYKYRDPSVKVWNLTITGVNLIKNLSKVGVFARNKVKEQAGVPEWIASNASYARACLRGLMDTDGGIYFHKHKLSNGRSYLNLGLTFTSHSVPLINFVLQTLRLLGFSAKKQDDGVYIYREGEVLKYAHTVGFSNPHNTKRLDQYLNKKGGVSQWTTEHAWKACES